MHGTGFSLFFSYKIHSNHLPPLPPLLPTPAPLCPWSAAASLSVIKEQIFQWYQPSTASEGAIRLCTDTLIVAQWGDPGGEKQTHKQSRVRDTSSPTVRNFTKNPISQEQQRPRQAPCLPLDSLWAPMTSSELNIWVMFSWYPLTPMVMQQDFKLCFKLIMYVYMFCLQ